MNVTDRFEAERSHLHGVAYRMLGSLSDADDVVQEAWLRYRRSDTSEVENLRGWLTTVVARLCLDALRARKSRREEPVGVRLPDPVLSLVDDAGTPEQQALLADSLGLALMVVLDELPPAERVAFVLHDVFGLPFDEIGRIVGRTPVATRKLASRARTRVRGSEPGRDPDRATERRVVAAFLAASRSGDFAALLDVLDPDVVVRADFGPDSPLSRETRGAEAVGTQALAFRSLAAGARPVLVNGAPGFLVYSGDRRYAVIAFTIRNGVITELDILADPDRLALL